ncbi:MULTISPECIES: LamG domain-containing protein [unclassified Nocardiopsis]|uniref:LamG domain-containing protein n=1 Tax=unclassified Nocardiopsis TaxID=2649073 RepID=UPI00135691B8|nr:MULTISPECIES: LamG domain-containing protein [unclassified Nocardiopsis]
MRHPLFRPTVAAAASALLLSLFSASPALAEDNRPPGRPETATLSARGESCSTDRDAPTLLNDTTLTLRGVFTDPDTETVAQQVKGEFEWKLDGGKPLGSAETTYSWQYPDRTVHPLSVTAKDLPEEVLIAYRARAHDGQDWGEWSERCWIEVSTSRPESPPQITSEDYPDDGRSHGGPYQPGEFTFSSNGVEDAVAYYYDGASGGSCTTRVDTEEPGGSVTVTITPERSGPRAIYARTVDAHGNSSRCEVVYRFMVAPLADPVAYFPLDEGEGTDAHDLLEAGRTASGTGDVGWTRGRVGARESASYRLEGTALDTSGGHLRTDASVVDTSAAFTVSAWVRLDGTGADAVALSQDGEHTSGFQLGYDSSEDAWVFQQSAQDVPGAGFDHRVVSTAPVRTGRWTQLTGHYDPEEGELALYVDGVRQGEAERDRSWNAEGPLVIGGGQEHGGFARSWPGAVDDVKLWNRPLLEQDTTETGSGRSELWDGANRPLAQEGVWRLDESDGEAAADGSDHGLDATLHGDPATVWDGAFNDWLYEPAVLLDGAGEEHLRTQGAAVRTDHSFTAAAWVRLDEAGADAVALSQSGEHTSGFALGYDAALGRWVFETAVRDESGEERVHRVASTTTAPVGEWVHLTGTYDHTDGTLTLYVDSSREGTVEREGAWHADGDVVIGAAGSAAGVDRPWTGGLQLAQVYQGAALLEDLFALEYGFLPL